MAEYVGRMLHGRSGAEVDHPFDGPDDLMTRSPVKVMRYFMEHVTTQGFVEHEDYEIYSALKSRDGGVVTVLGEFLYAMNNSSPFVCMIAPKP
jgi:hypothetical protein